MANKNSNQHGLIILGNSGVGKSFLANVLLGKDAFKHEFSARSVTHRTEFQEITFDNHRYASLIFLTRVDVNKREIDHAFTQRPNSLVIYVFGQQNGRIRDEDVVAFEAINKAYPLNIDSLLIVVNGLPSDRPQNYEGEVMLMLQDITNVPVAPERVCFLDHINRDKPAERQALKNQLLRAIVELTPTEHKKVQDIHLRVDEVAFLKEQIEAMTRAFEENKVHFQNEIREHQERYDRFVENQRVESDHFRRIIERQTEDAKEMRQTQDEKIQRLQETHTSQLAAMQQHIEQMQEEHEQLSDELESKSNEEASAIREALEASNQAQEELRQKIKELQNLPPTVIHTTESSSCFISGTMIRMADGTDKPIEKIQVGDVVLGAGNQIHTVMLLDVEQLQDRHLYAINDCSPFFTSEHVFLTTDGTMVAVDPQASEDEEPSLRGLVNPLGINVELQSLDQSRASSVRINRLTCSKADPLTNVYNVVLESGHTYYANGFCVFDMFPNLAQYPRMFKFLHLLWRHCAIDIDANFDDIITPGSMDRQRLENLAQTVQHAISDFCPKIDRFDLNRLK